MEQLAPPARPRRRYVVNSSSSDENESTFVSGVGERQGPLCGCRGGGTLAVLQDVQRAYEDQMEALERLPASRKLQAQADVLRAWVSDLVGQNSLLARAVEELEAEATSQLARERRRHMEIVLELRAELAALRRRLARKDSDLRGLLEVLRRLREFDSCALSRIHFHGLTKSDIFGSEELQKLQQVASDSHPRLRTKTENQSYRHRRK